MEYVRCESSIFSLFFFILQQLEVRDDTIYGNKIIHVRTSAFSCERDAIAVTTQLDPSWRKMAYPLISAIQAAPKKPIRNGSVDIDGATTDKR